MKIDSVRKDDEHKVVMRLHDERDGGTLLVVLTTHPNEDLVYVNVLDMGLGRMRKLRFTAGNMEASTYVPLVAQP